jgi:hypothetical protein
MAAVHTSRVQEDVLARDLASAASAGERTGGSPETETADESTQLEPKSIALRQCAAPVQRVRESTGVKSSAVCSTGVCRQDGKKVQQVGRPAGRLPHSGAVAGGLEQVEGQADPPPPLGEVGPMLVPGQLAGSGYAPFMPAVRRREVFGSSRVSSFEELGLTKARIAQLVLSAYPIS